MWCQEVSENGGVGDETKRFCDVLDTQTFAET